MWKRIISWSLVLICMGLIFWFSSANSIGSSAQSKGILYHVVDAGIQIAEKLNIIEREPSEKSVDKVVKFLNAPTRKLAHVTVYFLLAILIMLALGTNAKNFGRNVLITIFICFIYSITDEFHQTFIDGRAGEFRDCMIDTMGATIACMIYEIFVYIIDRFKKEE